MCSGLDSHSTGRYGSTIGSKYFNWTVPALWAKSKAAWRISDRRAAVEAFNSTNRWRKRGLAMMPIKCVRSWVGWRWWADRLGLWRWWADRPGLWWWWAGCLGLWHVQAGGRVADVDG